MSIPPTTPQPLQAILLIIKSGSGPRLVLNYPPLSPQASSGLSTHRPHRQSPTPGTTSTSVYFSDSEANSHESDQEGLGESENNRRNKDAVVDGRLKQDQGSSWREPLEGNSSGNTAWKASDSEHASFGNNGRPNGSSDELAGSSKDEDQALEDWLGASEEALARLLAPSSRKWHKRRFELCLDSGVFLGCPIFEKEEGGWGKKQKKDERKTMRKRREARSGADSHTETRDMAQEVEEYDDDNDDDDDTDTIEHGVDGVENSLRTVGIPTPTTAVPASVQEAPVHSRMRTQTETHMSLPSSVPSNNASTSFASQSSSMLDRAHNVPENLTMFNIVFIMNPSPLQHNVRVKEMYDHVVKKFSKALKWQQKKNGWVWSESRTIQGIKEKARENGSSYRATWRTIASKSSLARAISMIYDNISQGHIAHLTLGRSFHLPLQIPQAMSTSQAPTPSSLQTPGLWLTTFDPNHLEGDDYQQASPMGGAAVNPHSALLLLQDVETLAKDITSSHTAEISDALVYYIKHSLPTKTLLKISKSTGLSLGDISWMSAYLIHWRRAIAIPPLYASNTYVVSPNADFRRLPEASAEFSRRFSALPNLTMMLGKLSALRSLSPDPKPYLFHIPSTDHKAAYMDILQWLMKGGWVAQLRTFCWVRVDAEVKAAVARVIALEETVASSDATAVSEDDSDEDGDNEGRGTRRKSSGGSRASSVLSPKSKSYLVPPKPPSEAGSTSTARTTVPISSLRVPPPKNAQGKDFGSTAGRNSSGSQEQRLSDGSTTSKVKLEEVVENGEHGMNASNFEPSIVLSPHKANALESRWLEYIGSRVADPEARQEWSKLLKYFDGKHAVEDIALREGWKRKHANQMLSRLIHDEGILLTVRHW